MSTNKVPMTMRYIWRQLLMKGGNPSVSLGCWESIIQMRKI